MRDIFHGEDLYQAKRLVSEVQILRKLTACEDNNFTVKLYDIIAPNLKN